MGQRVRDQSEPVTLASEFPERSECPFSTFPHDVSRRTANHIRRIPKIEERKRKLTLEGDYEFVKRFAQP